MEAFFLLIGNWSRRIVRNGFPGQYLVSIVDAHQTRPLQYFYSIWRNRQMARMGQTCEFVIF